MSNIIIIISKPVNDNDARKLPTPKRINIPIMIPRIHKEILPTSKISFAENNSIGLKNTSAIRSLSFMGTSL